MGWCKLYAVSISAWLLGVAWGSGIIGGWLCAGLLTMMNFYHIQSISPWYGSCGVGSEYLVRALSVGKGGPGGWHSFSGYGPPDNVVQRYRVSNSIGDTDLIIHNREKDAHSTAADWYAELLSTDPWFKDMVPDVCDPFVLRVEMMAYACT